MSISNNPKDVWLNQMLDDGKRIYMARHSLCCISCNENDINEIRRIHQAVYPEDIC